MHDSVISTAELLSSETVLTEAAQSGSTATGSIVWLHGLGADGHDFVPLVPILQRCQRLALKFIFPHAPIRPVTINGGMQMRAWYDIKGIDLTGARLLDQEGIDASIAQTKQLIQHEIQQGIPANRIVVAGFSQGGVIALSTSLEMRDELLGTMGLSCYLPPLDPTAESTTNQGTALPSFNAHGQHDPMVPIALGKQAADLLSAQGFAVTWKEYPAQHTVHEQEIADIDEWLYKLFQ